MNPFAVVLLSLWACLLSACGSSIPPPEVADRPAVSVSATPEELPSRRDLYRAFRSRGKMLLVYAGGDSLANARYAALGQLMAERIDGFKVIAKHADSIPADSLLHVPLLLVGTAQAHPLIQELSPQLPFSYQKGKLIVDEKIFSDPSSIFCLSFYPNPLNPRLPLSLFTGQNDEALYSLLADRWSHLVWESWDYEVYAKERKLLMGKFASGRGEDWRIDRDRQFDFRGAEGGSEETAHFRFVNHAAALAPQALQQLQQRLEEKYKEVSAYLEGAPGMEEKIAYHLYPSTERKGLMIHNTEQMSVDMANQAVHAVHNEEFEGNYLHRELEILLRKRLGAPPHPALERGLAISFAPKWQKQGAAYWAKRLYDSGNLPPLSELFDNELFGKESDLVMGAAAGSFVGFLREHWGQEELLARYTSWKPKKNELNKLERAWHRSLEQQAKASPQARLALSSNCLRGFNFTHEGYQIYNGYISQKATESLEYLQGMGVNAVAIVPYTGMRDHTQPSYLPIMDRPGTENDESVIHSLYAARQLGMKTLLKPQVWLWSSWPGDVNFSREEDWQAFFDYYYRWIRHYALLGEMQQADIFCLGVEFQQATLKHPEAWRAMVKRLRGLFSGPITYAANWGEEFEKFDFWEELDYIGINCYYPLSSKENPTEAELRKGCKKVMKKVEEMAEKHKKPVLFTEIGFRSVKSPWQEPHAEAGKRPYDAAHQALAYRIAFESMQGKPWCQGIFWWKWPTIMTSRGTEDRRFIPYQKPAEQVVRQFYGR